jgi:hypothetical protein
MPALRVYDRVLYDGKIWRVASLGRDAYHREGNKMVVNGELYATLLLEADQPGSRPPYKIVLPESKWDEVRLLEE